MSTLVRLRDSLSNPPKALRRLFAILNERGPGEIAEVKPPAHHAVVAQTGASDPASVRLDVTENRKLSPSEIAEVVTRYLAGASIRSLARAFGLHEQTIRAHLKRQGVTMRPVRALTEIQEDEVVRLYVEEMHTLAELAVKFGIGQGAIRSVLVRRGVVRRPQARRQK